MDSLDVPWSIRPRNKSSSLSVALKFPPSIFVEPHKAVNVVPFRTLFSHFLSFRDLAKVPSLRSAPLAGCRWLPLLRFGASHVSPPCSEIGAAFLTASAQVDPRFMAWRQSSAAPRRAVSWVFRPLWLARLLLRQGISNGVASRHQCDDAGKSRTVPYCRAVLQQCRYVTVIPG